MRKNDDYRSAVHDESEPSGQERRGSCRYPVAEVPAFLSWWDATEASDEAAAGFDEEGADHEADTLSRVFDTLVYSAIMARVPALYGSARPASPPAAAANGTTAESARGRAAQGGDGGAGGNGQAKANGAAKGKAAHRAERDQAQARRASEPSGEPTMHSCRALILDISYTGASVLSETSPLQGQPVWLRLDGVEPCDWVEGIPRGIAPSDHGHYLVRIQFRAACPYDFFKAAVYGTPGKS